MRDISLRPATPADENFVNQLTRTCMEDYVRKTWPDKESEEKYFEKNRFTLGSTKIICRNAKNIGRISVIEDKSEVHLDNIHLVPEEQGRGIGRILIQELMERAKGEGLPVKLQVLRENPAKNLYLQLGFRVYDENTTHFFMTTE